MSRRADAALAVDAAPLGPDAWVPTWPARELVPLHRIGDPDADIAGIVSFLIAPEAGYITGQNILADGGLMDIAHGLIPGRPATQR